MTLCDKEPDIYVILTLAPHEAPRFGRLRLPQLGAGLLRNGADLLESGRARVRACRALTTQ